MLIKYASYTLLVEDTLCNWNWSQLTLCCLCIKRKVDEMTEEEVVEKKEATTTKNNREQSKFQKKDWKLLPTVLDIASYVACLSVWG